MNLSETIHLLESLIKTPSFSREEDKTAALLYEFFNQQGLSPKRDGNNVFAFSKYWDDQKPTLLLNSHHDTVRPAQGWTSDPFSPQWQGDHLVGLGANDAGGPLVCLIATFTQLHARKDLAYNLVLAATAEEEISGPNGIADLLPKLPKIACGIVGEPTTLNMAIAERGLIVIDGEAIGKAGHAARKEGINALYLALDDIQKLRDFQFPNSSELLGPVQVSITQIEAGSQHNVVPDRCKFVIDVRVNEAYSNEEVVQQLQSLVKADLKPRSLRLQSSGIDLNHPLVQSGFSLGLSTYGSPTLSDQALMSFPSLKLGPGQSARSHTAGEYITKEELAKGIATYTSLIENLS